MRFLLLAFVLAGCGSAADSAPSATLDDAVIDAGPDCSAAVCTRVTWTPGAGGIAAGQGLPHIGCTVSVAGCFVEACASDHAWCGDVPR